MANAISRGARPVRVRRLRGGLGGSTHRVTLERRSGHTFDVVLKRYFSFDGFPRHEWEATEFATTLPVTSPDPLTLDADGAWFGAPSSVVSYVEGRPELWFEGSDRWYRTIAETMLGIAATSKRGLPPVVRRKQTKLEPPDGLRVTPLVERAIETIDALLPAALTQERVVSHGDFHPGNMLWSRGRLAMVDWGAVRVERRTRDVVYCRTELAVLRGAREADRFLKTYESVAGERLEHVVVWDLMQGLTAMRWVKGWAYAYREQGRKDLTDEIAVRRARNVVSRALATCSS